MADGAGLALSPVRFDHVAASAAATRLVELAALIDDVVHRRGSRLARLSGWEGARRGQFDLAFALHQQNAAEVAERCRAMASRIGRAAALAAATPGPGQAPTAW